MTIVIWLLAAAAIGIAVFVIRILSSVSGLNSEFEPRS